MLVCLGASSLFELLQSLVEVLLVGSTKEAVLFPIQIKVEGRDGLNVIRLGTVSHLVGLTSCKHNLGVFISTAKRFILWLEVHAGPAVRGPKVNNHAGMVRSELQQMSL